MKKIFFLLLFVLFSSLSEAQEYKFFVLRDGVDVSCKYDKDFLWLKFTNNRNEKVYVSFNKIRWKQGEMTLEDRGGGAVTLDPQGSSSSGMYFAYPKGYDYKNYQSLHFVLFELKVEIGGMGNDPRYQKTSTTKNSTDIEDFSALDFNNNTYKPKGSNEWKKMPDQKIIKLPGDDKKNSTTPNQNNSNQKNNNNSSQNSTLGSNSSNTKVESVPLQNGNQIKQKKEDQKQVYQNQANDYLNKAQDDSGSPVTKSLDLNLAAMNAKLSGNQKQVQEIQTMQDQQRQVSNEQLIQSGVDLINGVFNLVSNQRKQREENKFEIDRAVKQYSLNKEAFLSYCYFNNYNNLYSDTYTEYFKGLNFNFEENTEKTDNKLKMNLRKRNIEKGEFCNIIFPEGSLKIEASNTSKYGRNWFEGSFLTMIPVMESLDFFYTDYSIDSYSYSPKNYGYDLKQARNGIANSQMRLGLYEFYERAKVSDADKYFKLFLSNPKAELYSKKIAYFFSGLSNLYQGGIANDTGQIKIALTYLDSSFKINFRACFPNINSDDIKFKLKKLNFSGFQTDILKSLIQTNNFLAKESGDLKYCRQATLYYLNYPQQEIADDYTNAVYLVLPGRPVLP